jgi:hypothetical protein
VLDTRTRVLALKRGGCNHLVERIIHAELASAQIPQQAGLRHVEWALTLRQFVDGRDAPQLGRVAQAWETLPAHHRERIQLGA